MKNRARHSSSLDFACFICDYWWLILLGVIILVFLTMNLPHWLGASSVPPSNGRPTPSIFHTPAVTGTPNVALSTPQSGWKVFRDEQLGYQIEYPQEWFASPLGDSGSPSGDAQESVLISNAANNTSAQIHTPDETARIWIVSHEKGQASLADWVTAKFSWIGGDLNNIQINSLPALQLETKIQDNPSVMHYMTWIDRGNTFLQLWGQYRTDYPNDRDVLDRMIFSLRFLP